MRTLAIAFTLLLLLPAAAAAKTGISLNPPPDGLPAGEPWDVSFSYIHNDAVVTKSHGHPSIEITSADGAITRTFRAQRGPQGTWMAQVSFPRAGTWNYYVHGFGTVGKNQAWEPVQIAARRGKAAPPLAAVGVSGGSSFPYGWVGAGVALLALTAGALVLRRRA